MLVNKKKGTFLFKESVDVSCFEFLFDSAVSLSFSYIKSIRKWGKSIQYSSNLCPAIAALITKLLFKENINDLQWKWPTTKYFEAGSQEQQAYQQ